MRRRSGQSRTAAVALTTGLVMLACPAAARIGAAALPGSLYPESLAAAADGTLLAGSAVDGSIVRLHPGTTAAESCIAPGSHGLMSVRASLTDDAAGLLWACAGDLGMSRIPKTVPALLAFSRSSGRAAGRCPLPGGGFRDDFAQLSDGSLLVTDTAGPRVMRFDTVRRRRETWVAHPLLGGAPFNGNGVVVDGGNVHVSTFADGRLIRVPPSPDGKTGEPVTPNSRRPLVGGGALRRLAPGQLLLCENSLPGADGQVTLASTEGDRAELARLAGGTAEPQLERVPLPRGFAYPNGVAVSGDGTLYVGSVTSGRILRRWPDGAWDALHAGSEAVFAATSLRLDEPRGLLWGASPDFAPARPVGVAPRAHQVFAVELATGTVRRSITLPDGGFGNDLAIDPQGGVYATDSRNPRLLYLAPGAERFAVVLEDARFEPAGGIGLAGVALGPDGTVVLGHFGTGRLYAARRTELGRWRVDEIVLPRRIDNPDGMALDPAGDLMLVEGAVASGDGKLLRIADPLAGEGPRRIDTLAAGLDSPVNLALTTRDAAWVTESGIRHLMAPGLPAPNAFAIVRVPLGRTRQGQDR